MSHETECSLLGQCDVDRVVGGEPPASRLTNWRPDKAASMPSATITTRVLGWTDNSSSARATSADSSRRSSAVRPLLPSCASASTVGSEHTAR